MAAEESLVSRRPRRSTAGNRMELALAELAVEEPQELPEEDIDFVVEKEEEDIFESDFASTDEEAVQEGIEEEDKTVREEERRDRKTARARAEKATAVAHARQRVTFNPEAAQPKSRPLKTKRRVSLGVVVNAETGEIIEDGAGRAGVKRQSQRRHTVMNTSATVNRMKDAEEKRAAIPKKTKMTTRLPTQDELIARALDTEEGNITEHKNYLLLEEEKRAKARVVKKSIEGPVLRWISKKETIQVEVRLPPPPPSTTAVTSANICASKYNFVYTSGIGSGSHAYSMPFYPYTPLATQNKVSKPQEATTSTPVSSSHLNGNPSAPSAGISTTPTSLTPLTTPLLASFSNIKDRTPPAPPQIELHAPPTAIVQTQLSSQPPSLLFSYPPPASIGPHIAHRTEIVCKNYVIHELSHSVPLKPPWRDTMSAMFGEHVRWDEVKVFTGKGRPLSRPIPTCLITGQPAKYRDPRTNAPFFDIGAYNVLTNVLGRGYVWCSTLGCYVGSAAERWSKAITSGGEAEESGNAGVPLKEGEGSVVDGDGDGELDERSTKRRRLEVAEEL